MDELTCDALIIVTGATAQYLLTDEKITLGADQSQ